MPYIVLSGKMLVFLPVIISITKHGRKKLVRVEDAYRELEAN
ncbi:MAG: hypothetical protein ACTS73_01660 [Arsenophonus sp. NEOnobi-MAG3]